MYAKLTLRIALTLTLVTCWAALPMSAGASCKKNWGIAGAAHDVALSSFQSELPANAEEEAPTSSPGKDDDASIVGLWHVLFVSAGQPFDEGYDQWHGDGTEILNDIAPPQPANGAGTICLGVYEKTGHRSYKLRHPFWIFDATATLVGTGVYLERVKVHRGGSHYSGTFEFITYDLKGNVTFEATGELHAERIKVD